MATDSKPQAKLQTQGDNDDMASSVVAVLAVAVFIAALWCLMEARKAAGTTGNLAGSSWYALTVPVSVLGMMASIMAFISNRSWMMRLGFGVIALTELLLAI